MSDATSPESLHASAVALNGKGCLILGPSGSGKSSLALKLIALGADLIADDRVVLARDHEDVILSAPEGLPSAIEARGVGLMNAPLCGPTMLRLVVDLTHTETQRLPEDRRIEVLGLKLPCLHNTARGDFCFAVAHYLSHGPASL